MKNILITGAAGFIGSNLCEYYLKNNYTVVGLDNLSTGTAQNILLLQKKYPQLFQFIQIDVCNTWPKLTGEFEIVYHLASPASVKQYTRLSLETMAANSTGLKNALQFADDKKARLVFASTSEIYGSPIFSPQPETYWGNTNSFGERSCYNESKRFGESLIYSWNKKHNTNHGIVRIFNTYGPGMNPKEDDRVVISFLKQALKNQDITIFGNGLQTRSFCYIDDLILGLKLYADSKINYPINLGNDSEITILELAEMIRLLSKSQSQIILKTLPADDPPQRCPDLTRARTELNWAPRTSLSEGLEKFFTWLKPQA